jgi:hypothetical protein
MYCAWIRHNVHFLLAAQDDRKLSKPCPGCVCLCFHQPGGVSLFFQQTMGCYAHTVLEHPLASAVLLPGAPLNLAACRCARRQLHHTDAGVCAAGRLGDIPCHPEAACNSQQVNTAKHVSAVSPSAEQGPHDGAICASGCESRACWPWERHFALPWCPTSVSPGVSVLELFPDYAVLLCRR